MSCENVKQLTPTQLDEMRAKNKALILIDVREPWEFALAKIKGSVLMPLPSLADNFTRLDKNASIVCICHHGIRSYHAACYLIQQGFKNVFNLQHGLDGWSEQIDASVARY